MRKLKGIKYRKLLRVDIKLGYIGGMIRFRTNMGTRLKTLKDIRKIYIEIGETEIVKTEDLKNEIIKHIKHHKSYHNKTRDAIATEFMSFINITEKELYSTVA